MTWDTACLFLSCSPQGSKEEGGHGYFCVLFAPREGSLGTEAWAQFLLVLASFIL